MPDSVRQMILNVSVIVTLFAVSFNKANTLCLDHKIKIQIPAISTIDDTEYMFDSGVDISETGGAITVGHMLAQQDLNSNNNILPCHEIEHITIPSDKKTAEAMKQTIFASFEGFCNGISSIIASPIFLGAPWSSLSQITALVLDMFNLLTISSTSTAPTLTTDHESFLRTIGSDIAQAKALVHLCNYFDWTQIGVIYYKDEYGQGLNNAIIDEITQNDTININIKSKPYDEHSMDNAAKFIKDQELYVTILIVRDVHIEQFFEQLEKHNLIGKPYYYIGVDSWFVEAEIKDNNILKYIPGYIGTIPGYLPMLTEEQYIKSGIYNGNMSIYNATMQKHNAISEIMKNKYYKNHHSMINFGYDSMYALGMALHIYDTRHSLGTMFNHFNECSLSNLEEFEMQIKGLESMQAEIRNILVNDVQFIGATGPVSFKEDGERRGSMFLYGYVTYYGEIKYFGGLIDGQDAPFIEDNIVEWPHDFDGEKPVSNGPLCLKTINTTFTNTSNKSSVNISNKSSVNISNKSTSVNISNNIVISTPYFYIISGGVGVVFLCLVVMIVQLCVKKPQTKIREQLGINTVELKSNVFDHEEEKADLVHNTQHFDESKTNDSLNSLSSHFQNYIKNLSTEAKKKAVITFIKTFKINELVLSSSSRTCTITPYTNSHLDSSKQSHVINGL
eukprot:34224_1